MFADSTEKFQYVNMDKFLLKVYCDKGASEYVIDGRKVEISRYFYYVPYGEANYAKVSEISDFSLNGGNAFTLCIGFIESQNSGILIFSENFSLAFHN